MQSRSYSPTQQRKYSPSVPNLNIKFNGEYIELSSSPRKGNYFDARSKLSESKLTPANCGEIIPFYNQNIKFTNRELRSPINEINGNSIIGDTLQLWIPSKGVYIKDNPPLSYFSISPEKLEMILKEDDSIKFVPRPFPLGKISPQDLVDNHYLVELLDGSLKEFVKLSARYKDPSPRVFGFEDVIKPTVTVTALRSFSNNHLILDGHFNPHWTGYMFGRVD
ncbi:hypothetical protein COU57_00250 [Candidatus Pacearchaeota archaeon CG10_big_fil_rev_8_21_14_0_10_32_14]|nr:MAG: hypothetical protein COU57_00250 [Candidatus Pacearchaeota archaeon CG10_big_fil_rev_8_21_14_0_10_32_14]